MIGTNYTDFLCSRSILSKPEDYLKARAISWNEYIFNIVKIIPKKTD